MNFMSIKCSSLPSFAVTNTESNLGRKGFVGLTRPDESVPEGSQGRSLIRQDPRGTLLTGLLPVG